jgi:hypothetical protein
MQPRKIAVLFSAILVFAAAIALSAQSSVRSAPETWGSLYRSHSQGQTIYRSVAPHGEDPLARLLYWNEIAINASLAKAGNVKVGPYQTLALQRVR